MPIPGEMYTQVNFITEQAFYYYAFINPSDARIKSILTNFDQRNVLISCISPTRKASFATLQTGSQVHKNLEGIQGQITDCGPENDITEAKDLAEGTLSLIGTELMVSCFEDHQQYDYFTDVLVLDIAD